MSGIVIQFKRRSLIKGALATCWNCSKVTGDPETELLQCDICGRYWTAWQWIFHTTRDWRTWKEEVQAYKAEAIKLKEEVEELRKQRSYIKRQLTAKEKTGEV